MNQDHIKFLPSDQAKQLSGMAERARLSLTRFAGVDTEYNAVGLQQLDEWIDRHLRQFPNPSSEMTMVWAAFLGEVFRRRFSGEWAVDTSTGKPLLGIVCPKENRGLLFVDVMQQMQRRLKKGMAESFSFYYTLKGVEIKQG